MNSYMTGLSSAILFLSLLFLSCTPKVEEEPQYGSEKITALPMNYLPLENFDAFRAEGDHWIISGNAWSDHEIEYSIKTVDGTGVLVNTAESGGGTDIYSKLEHGDIELKLEFMIPKNSNSGIYFQDRYELQILDSWLREERPFL
jgi:hypothetical protein